MGSAGKLLFNKCLYPLAFTLIGSCYIYVGKPPAMLNMEMETGL